MPALNPLRPRRLDEFVGQPRTREQLGVILDSSRQRGDAPDHLLFSGPPGLGKTTLLRLRDAFEVSLSALPVNPAAGVLAISKKAAGDPASEVVAYVERVYGSPWACADAATARSPE